MTSQKWVQGLVSSYQLILIYNKWYFDLFMRSDVQIVLGFKIIDFITFILSKLLNCSENIVKRSPLCVVVRWDGFMTDNMLRFCPSSTRWKSRREIKGVGGGKDKGSEMYRTVARCSHLVLISSFWVW